MILDMKPLSMAEVKEFIKDVEEKKELKDYLKKYSKVSQEKAKEISEAIRGLGNIKIRETDVVKVVDFLPQTPEEVNKIFSEVSLDEKEINDILNITKGN